MAEFLIVSLVSALSHTPTPTRTPTPDEYRIGEFFSEKYIVVLLGILLLLFTTLSDWHNLT